MDFTDVLRKGYLKRIPPSTIPTVNLPPRTTVWSGAYGYAVFFSVGEAKYVARPIPQVRRSSIH